MRATPPMSWLLGMTNCLAGESRQEGIAPETRPVTALMALRDSISSPKKETRMPSVE